MHTELYCSYLRLNAISCWNQSWEGDLDYHLPVIFRRNDQGLVKVALLLVDARDWRHDGR